MIDTTMIPVEGKNWTKGVVAQSKSADEFVKLHMPDKGIYKHMSVEQKEAALRLTYSLCVPARVEADKIPKDDEQAEEAEKPLRRRK